MTSKLLPCPFCGNTPHFDGDASEWKDDHRYVELTLMCCVNMKTTIGWSRARYMTHEARDNEMRDVLTNRWNIRHVDTE